MGNMLDIEDIEARLSAAPSCDCGRPSTQWCADSECGAETCDEHAGRSAPMGHAHRWSRYPIGAADIVHLIAELRTLRALVETAHGDSRPGPSNEACLRLAARAIEGVRPFVTDVLNRITPESMRMVMRNDGWHIKHDKTERYHRDPTGATVVAETWDHETKRSTRSPNVHVPNVRIPVYEQRANEPFQIERWGEIVEWAEGVAERSGTSTVEVLADALTFTDKA